MQASLRASSGPRRSTDSATSAHSPHHPRQQQRAQPHPHPHPQPLAQRTSPTHSHPHGGTPASPISGHSNSDAHGHAQPNGSASGHHAQPSLPRAPSTNAGHTSRHSQGKGKGGSPGSGPTVRRSRSRGAGSGAASGSDPLDEYAADCESDSEPCASPRVSGRRSAAASPRNSRPSRQRPSARERDRVAALQQQEQQQQQHAAAAGSSGDRGGDRGGAGSDVDSQWVDGQGQGQGQGGSARYASDQCISDAEPASPALADGSYSPGLNLYGSGGGGGGGGAGRWRSAEGVSPRAPPAHSASGVGVAVGSPHGDSPASPFGAHAHPQPYARTRLGSASSTPRAAALGAASLPRGVASGLAPSPHDPGPGSGHASGLSSREGSVTMSPGAALGPAAGPQLFQTPTSRLQHVGSAHEPSPGRGAPGSPGGRPMSLPPQFAGLQVAVDSPSGSTGGAGAGYSPRRHGHGHGHWHGGLHGQSPLGLAVAREGSVVLASPRAAEGYTRQGSGVLARVGSMAGGGGGSGTRGEHMAGLSRQGSFAGHPGTPRGGGGGGSGVVSHAEVMSPKRTSSVTAAGGMPLMSSVMLACRTTKQQQQHVGQGRGAGGNSGAFVGEVVVARVGSITGRVGSITSRAGSMTGRVGSMTASGRGPGEGREALVAGIGR